MESELQRVGQWGAVGVVSGRGRCWYRQRHEDPVVRLLGRHQPAMDPTQLTDQGCEPRSRRRPRLGAARLLTDVGPRGPTAARPADSRAWPPVKLPRRACGPGTDNARHENDGWRPHQRNWRHRGAAPPPVRQRARLLIDNDLWKGDACANPAVSGNTNLAKGSHHAWHNVENRAAGRRRRGGVDHRRGGRAARTRRHPDLHASSARRRSRAVGTSCRTTTGATRPPSASTSPAQASRSPRPATTRRRTAHRAPTRRSTPAATTATALPAAACRWRSATASSARSRPA